MATAVFVGLWLWQVRASEGFLEADACTHFLIAKYAFAEPYRFADVWGRPLKTALYAVPAVMAGRVGVRAMSLALGLVVAWAARGIARDVGVKSAGLAYAFTLAMPLVFLHSFSELTELPFAALLGVTYLAWTRGWGKTAALLAGLLPLGRPEGFPLAALAGGILVWQAVRSRRGAVVVALALLPAGVVGWSLLGWQTSGNDGNPLTWILRHWPYAGESVYTQNLGMWEKVLHLFKFTLALPAVTGPVLFPAFLMGTVALVRSRRCAVLLVPGLVLGGHSLLYFLGKMASNGELRYLLVAAPFWGAICAVGWERAFEFLGRSRIEAVRFAAYAAVLPLLLSLRLYNVLPIAFDDSWRSTRLVAGWAQRTAHATQHGAIMAAHPGVYYFLGISNNDPVRAREFTVANVQRPPAGTLLLFDPIYCCFNASRARRVDGSDEIEAAGWVKVPISLPDGWRAYLSPEPAR